MIITGRVCHGKALGRTLGMPTVNLSPDNVISARPMSEAGRGAPIDLPSILAKEDFGVYYSVVVIDGQTYKAITNIGIRPTVTSGRDADPPVTIETYICDFSGELYGQEITVALLAFRRPEKHFSSLEELSATVREDMEACRAQDMLAFCPVSVL